MALLDSVLNAVANLSSVLQRAIRAFLKVRTSYDVLPLSYRLIVFDTALLVKKSLNILIQCGKSADKLAIYTRFHS